MSVKLSELKIVPGSRTKHFRKGIGIGTGNGKRAGRGQKGAGARSGASKGPGFEGGQLPLFRRFPKRGFNSLNKKVIATVSLDKLSVFKDGETVDFAKLVQTGFVKQSADGFKVLADGKLTAKNLTVKANCFSANAKKAIEANGGKAEVVED